MKKFIFSVLALFLLFPLFTTRALAAVSEQEANEVLAEKGWERDKFNQFLDYYELSLEDFDSKEDLSTTLGTPINEKNLNRLLADYGFTRKDLDQLLGEFGMTVDDHWSIEELDASIEFYINNQEDIDELEDFIKAIGITDEEGERLFSHFEKLDQLKLEEEMEKIGSRLESLIMLDPEAELTKKQIDEVISVWEDIMKIVNLNPKFYLVDGSTKIPVSFRTLATLEEFNHDAIYVQLYDINGKMLLDMQVSAEMLSSDFIINAGGKIADIGELAGELTKLRHGSLPDTASPYGLYLFIGMICFLCGASMMVFRKHRMKQPEC